MIKQIYRLLIQKNIREIIYLKRTGRYYETRKLIKVYSHPRSGTHFLEAFLAKNFYKNVNLEIKPIRWGHWSNPQTNEKGNPFGKLFGSHWDSEHCSDKKRKKIYIYRDGRAVAYSIWNTDNFIHKKLKGISFSDFLKTPIDWCCAPEIKTDKKITIGEHWYNHVNSWHSRKDKNLLIIRYEELKKRPEIIYKQIEKKFFPLRYRIKKIFRIETKIDPITKPLGLKPNQGKIDSWKNILTSESEELFILSLPNTKYLYEYDS